MIEIRIVGMPAPQGSKRHVGRGIMIESSAKVKPWREAVKYVARQFPMLKGPVHVNVTFTLPRPKSAPKKRIYPERRPDLDKLCRSTLDALVMAGTIEDDAKVVSLLAVKTYPNEGQDCLDVPGAVIKIRSLAGGVI